MAKIIEPNQVTLKLDEILDLADTIENWSSWSTGGFYACEAEITRKFPQSALRITLSPNTTCFLNRLKSIDVKAYFLEKDTSKAIHLGLYQNITWPKAIKAYTKAKECAIKAYYEKQQKNRLEGLAYARSLLHKEK